MSDEKKPVGPTNYLGEPQPYIMRLHSLKRDSTDPLPAPCEQCRERIDLMQAAVDELIEWAARAYSGQIELEMALADLRKKIDAPPVVLPPLLS